MEPMCKTELFRSYLNRFVTFTDEEWTIFESFLSYRKLAKKEHFTRAEQVCDHIGYLLSGAVRHYHLKDGLEITGYFSMENELTTAYKSFITRAPGTSNIQALENTELILISHQNFQQMLDHPLLRYKIERFGRLIAEYTICCYEDRVFSFITQSPEERYLKMLVAEPQLLKRIPQHYIANYLGITPVSLSRIRKRSLRK